MRSAMWEKNLRSFYWRSQSQLAKGSRDFESFPFMQKIAVKCPVLRREGPMKQWNNGIKKRFTCFVTIDPIAFTEFFERNFFCWLLCLGSMFLMTCLTMVKVPPPFSTSIQDGYLEVGEIMQATMLGSSHGVSHLNPPIPIGVYLWSKLLPFLYIKLVPFWLFGQTVGTQGFKRSTIYIIYIYHVGKHRSKHIEWVWIWVEQWSFPRLVEIFV